MHSFLWLEILVIVGVVIFFASLIAVYIYKKTHHIPTGECACCAEKKRRLVKEYNKTYKK